MGKIVRDEFTHLPISRQRKYQLRMRRDKRCHICGEPVVTGFWCLKHVIEERERHRKRVGSKRRNKVRSYALEAEARAAARSKRSKQAD
jgi:hypothetical protein